MRNIKRTVLAALFAVVTTPAMAAVITFDLTGPTQVVSSLVVTDTTNSYSVDVTANNYIDGLLIPHISFEVTQGALGLGVQSNTTHHTDTSDGLDTAGPNDRIRFDFGANVFTLVSADLVLNGTTGSEFFHLLTGGAGDIHQEASILLGAGSHTVSFNETSSVFDFRKPGAGGGYITSLTFETGEPLPGGVPAPASLALLGLGLIVLGVRKKTS